MMITELVEPLQQPPLVNSARKSRSAAYTRLVLTVYPFRHAPQGDRLAAQRHCLQLPSIETGRPREFPVYPHSSYRRKR